MIEITEEMKQARQARLLEAEAQIDANILSAQAEGKTVAIFPVSVENEPVVYDALFSKYNEKGYFIRLAKTVDENGYFTHEIYW